MAASFAKHCRAPRLFRVLLAGVVHIVSAALTRWRCLECGATFRHYPPGLLPYMRYLARTLLPLSERYLSDATVSYRRLANCGGPGQSLPAFHGRVEAETPSTEWQKQRERTPALSHTTLWERMAALKELWKEMTTRAERLQNRRDRVLLEPLRICPFKWRSEKRRQVLLTAANMLAVLRADGFFTANRTLCSGP